MKLRFSIITACICSAFLTLTACSSIENNQNDPIAQTMQTKKDRQPSEVKTYIDQDLIFVDKETGCEYLRSIYDTPFTPRLNADGVPMCKNTKKQ
ncbi:DUF6440 family protein [Paenibacillus sp. NRS-1783]|uniref:DUF6440 family protein n=1 Tax=Paenibacillus sp. NRS-1783 TaxID=3233907 RepID=UPI003D27EAE4